MKKNTKVAPKNATKALNVFELKTDELNTVQGGQGVIILVNGFRGYRR